MKKDIPQHRVEELAIAIVPSEEGPEMWDSYLINMKKESIKNVLINSRGYGDLEGEAKNTTILRHFFEEVGGERIQLIEPLPESLFDLTNEFWISFSLDGYMYDKKYVFVKGSIDSEFFTEIPYLDRKGVMIR